MKIEKKNITKFARMYQVTKPAKFRLKDVDPGDTNIFKSVDFAKKVELASRQAFDNLFKK